MKIRSALAVALITILLPVMPVAASEPYKNYTFSKDGTAVEEPQAYLPSKIITGEDLGVGGFNNPEDIYVAENGHIYIADAGNDRVLALDENFQPRFVLDTFTNDGQEDRLSNPSGIFATDTYIYVADTDNARVVVFNMDGTFAIEYGKPSAGLVSTDTLSYKPIKVAVDTAGRLFIVALNENNGMIELAADGSFTGYFGAVKTSRRLFDIFNFTEAQKENASKNVPVEYSNVDIDSDGFVFGTVAALPVGGKINENIFVQRFNPSGIDVLKRYGDFPIMGDINYEMVNDTPDVAQLCDVAVGDSGIYAVLGKKTGRVYVYDANGSLLFQFGGIGSGQGLFSLPVALDNMDGDQYLVLDRNYNQIQLFQPTEYGSLILKATREYFNREYEKAENSYAQMLKYSTKANVAFNGMGRALYRQKNYEEAMRYFKLSGDKDSYSEAFKHLRTEFMDRYFSLFAGIVLTLVGVVVIIKIVSVYKKWRKNQ